MVIDLVDGPNSKGRTYEQTKTELNSDTVEDSDPLTDQHLPRAHREHAREYFDRFRDN